MPITSQKTIKGKYNRYVIMNNGSIFVFGNNDFFPDFAIRKSDIKEFEEAFEAAKSFSQN
jgi:hypothetical protein